MTLLIDSYDSFSYNLYQMVGEIDPDIRVVRNDELTADEIAALKPDRIILSPGPGRPEDAGVIEEVAARLGEKTPVLGVCLGHQAICEAFGGNITYVRRQRHGKQSVAKLDADSPLFRGLPAEIRVARYHSLAADPESLPACLKVTATAEDGEIMAVRHETFPVYGVQFHPESVLTPEGKKILENFIREI